MSFHSDIDSDLPSLPIPKDEKSSKKVGKRAYRRYLNNMVTFSELEEIYNYDTVDINVSNDYDLITSATATSASELDDGEIEEKPIWDVIDFHPWESRFLNADASYQQGIDNNIPQQEEIKKNELKKIKKFFNVVMSMTI